MDQNLNLDSGSPSIIAELPVEPPPAPGAPGAASICVIAWLAVTTPLLPLGGTGPARLGVLALHLGAIAALVGLPLLAVRGAAGRFLGEWLPLLLVGFLYWELPALMEGMPGEVRYHDPAIVAAERALFGGEPAYDWAGAMPWLPLSELLHACYLSYYLLIFAPPLLLWIGPRATPGAPSGASDAFRETVLAVMLAFLACFVVFVVLPVQGPRYLGVPEGVPDGPVRRLVLDVLEAGSSRGAAFPSSHVSVAVAQALMALRHQPRVGRRILPVAIGLAAGAVYGGFHYGIDALVGAAVGAAAAAAAAPLRRRIERRGAGFTSARNAV